MTSSSSGKTRLRLPTTTEIRDLARRYEIRPLRALGQNFVVDGNTVRRIVRLAGVSEGDRVVEVGAGLGMLTLGLVMAGARVLAIELDRRLIPALKEIAGEAGRVEIRAADALSFDYTEAFGGEPFRFVSNLPYNISVPLLAKLIEDVPQVADFVVLVQREVGERLAAGPGSRTYGAVSVLVALHCGARILGRVPPTVFWPQPRVESVLLRLNRLPVPEGIDTKEVMTVVRAAFGQRRKLVKNSLAASLKRPLPEIVAALARARIDPAARAESLGVAQFVALTRELGNRLRS